MNKPQILARKRPIAPSTTQPTSATNQQPIAPTSTSTRAVVPSSATAQPTQPAAKPKPRPRPKPANEQGKEQQVFQAIGVIEAELVIKLSRVILVCPDGDRCGPSDWVNRCRYKNL